MYSYPKPQSVEVVTRVVWYPAALYAVLHVNIKVLQCILTCQKAFQDAGHDAAAREILSALYKWHLGD